MIKFEDFANAIDSDHVRYLVICSDKPYADYLSVTEARNDKCVYRGKHIDYFDIVLTASMNNEINVDVVVRIKA
jgi:hypothetical protein